MGKPVSSFDTPEADELASSDYIPAPRAPQQFKAQLERLSVTGLRVIAGVNICRARRDNVSLDKENKIMSLTMRAMQAAMFKVNKSKHDFEQTVQMVRDNALRVGWDVPWRFELQQHYQDKGLADMTKVINVYLCNPQGGYDIMKGDAFKPMAVMMPTAVSVYETSAGEVHISRMNLGRMSAMFGGTVRAALKGGGANLEKALEGIIEN